jgi:hypothetical protein
MKYWSVLITCVFLLAACSKTTSPNTPTEIVSQASQWASLEAVVSYKGFVTDIVRNTPRPKVVFDINNRPIVAWALGSLGTSSFNIFAKRWNGSQWLALGGEVTGNDEVTGTIFPDIPAEYNTGDFHLKVDKTGRPIIAYGTDSSNPTFEGKNVVKRWEGNQWVTLGSFPAAPGGPIVGLTVDSQNRPVLLTGFTAWYFDNMTWKKLTNALPVIPGGIYDGQVLLKDFALDATDKPIVAYTRRATNSKRDLYVIRWNGTQWKQLGSALDFNQANDIDTFYDNFVDYDFSKGVQLVVDKTNTPFVAWLEQFVNADNSKVIDDNLYVKKWNGTQWLLLGRSNVDTAGIKVQNPSLAINSQGRPVIAYDEFLNKSRNIYVKYLTGGNTWSYLGAQLDNTLAKQARQPSVALNSLDKATIVWAEYTTSATPDSNQGLDFEIAAKREQ